MTGFTSCDFGLQARVEDTGREEAHEKTAAHSDGHFPAYMSPRRARGKCAEVKTG